MLEDFKKYRDQFKRFKAYGDKDKTIYKMAFRRAIKSFFFQTFGLILFISLLNQFYGPIALSEFTVLFIVYPLLVILVPILDAITEYETQLNITQSD